MQIISYSQFALIVKTFFSGKNKKIKKIQNVH